MPDEMIDIVDEMNVPTGETELKSIAHRDGLWHRSVHIWIFGKDGILLQLRSKDNYLYPNCWDISAAGHIQAGETSEQAAIREVKEETGLDVKEDDLQYLMTKRWHAKFGDIDNREFYFIFLVRYDGTEQELTPQQEELQKLRFFSPEEIKRSLKEHPEKYVPHNDYWAEMIDIISKISK